MFKVKCDTCKCLLYKSDAQRVKIDGVGALYFCAIHKKKYTSVYQTSWGHNMYYGQFQVSADGEPYGYVKESEPVTDVEELYTNKLLYRNTPKKRGRPLGSKNKK